MKVKLTIFITLFLTIFSYAQTLEEVDITSDGMQRKFWLRFPAAIQDLDTDLPVIITLHGDGGTGPGIASYSGIAGIASTYNFIGVFPNATAGGWNRAVLGSSPADDLQFISDIIDYLCENYSINSNRVYVTGHSAGGFLAYRMAIEMPGKIAAIAPVAGNMYGDAGNGGNAYIQNYFGSSNFIQMPILHIHGDNDNVVSYPDPDHQPTAWSEYPLTGFSYPTCGVSTYESTNVTDINANVKKITYCFNGSGSKEISLIRIIGGGHEWPSTQLPGIATDIVQFFYTYSRDDNQACNDLNVENLSSDHIRIFPNPVENVLTINTTEMITSVRLLETSGRLVQKTENVTGDIDVSGLNSGMYLLIAETEKDTFIRKILKK